MEVRWRIRHPKRRENEMRFIGDTHAKFDRYQAIANEVSESIQVGDFGAGFDPLPAMGLGHRFIRGNHDDPARCAQSLNWISDGTSIHSPDHGSMFFMGGATSVDKHTRSEGIDYWSDEEVTIVQGNSILDYYEEDLTSWGRFDFVVTHECPESVARTIFNRRRDKLEDHSRTRQILDAMLEIGAPRCWIFGHWHTNVDVVIGDTRFICLAELAHIDLTAEQISG